VASTSNLPLICGFEPFEGPYICVLDNNHEALGVKEHLFVPLSEYYALNLRSREN